MDQFFGRAYVFIPCYLDGRALKAVETEQGSYVSEMADRFSEEVSNRSWNQFERGTLGRFSFNFYGESEKDTNCEQLPGDVYFTLNQRTQLCILTIVFGVNGEPITQLLDRVSREGIEIANGDERNASFYEYLKANHGLQVSGKARVCLSTGQKLSDILKPSVFANEMFESDVMESAGLLPTFGQGCWQENIAVYNSSEIYASKTTVLRYDSNLDNGDPELSGMSVNAIRRDLMLTFIIELLMFREASIKRANLRVTHSIQTDEKLELDDINDLMGDFKAAILFWDLDIFLYPSAQQLADSLFEKFDIDRSLETYRKNQSFLEQRVNLSNAAQAEKETRTINYIAIIVFFFEAVPLLFVLAESLIQKKPLNMLAIYSGIAAISVSFVLFVAILGIVRMRRLTKKAVRS
ncbi:hypothetical protein EST55_11725 [Idiomarina sp. 29L]|uniref:hypothetical protein n=1 Tax=Idiomarina sp. 29L TaxID=2508877 RepID=UPI0010109FCF|nr:hypothetical protein [Idiomarina sp. 29L]RXS41573.1 hypothetical protein EST55_11725 [Idiomarina sp. 29L]